MVVLKKFYEKNKESQRKCLCIMKPCFKKKSMFIIQTPTKTICTSSLKLKRSKTVTSPFFRSLISFHHYSIMHKRLVSLAAHRCVGFLFAEMDESVGTEIKHWGIASKQTSPNFVRGLLPRKLTWNLKMMPSQKETSIPTIHFQVLC